MRSGCFHLRYYHYELAVQQILNVINFFVLHALLFLVNLLRYYKIFTSEAIIKYLITQFHQCMLRLN